MSLSPIQEILADFKAGKMVILVDEEDRENEGDLVLAADFVTPEAINFMARFGRGLVCLTLTEQRCRQLNLPLMASHNGTRTGTNFTVSIEAAEGVSTGISAADRARTIQMAVAPDARPEDIVQPGHIFPIMARPGGVLMRAGHTEAGCDLGFLAGLTPASVICEIMKDDGTMARLPDLEVFAREHQLRIGAIADLIHYRAARESLIERLGEQPLQTAQGRWRAVLYRDTLAGAPHLALVCGEPAPDRDVLVRVHEPTSILDMLETTHTTHSWPVHRAMTSIAEHGCGVVVLLNCAATADQLFGAFEGLLALQRGDGAPARQAKRAANSDLRTYGVGAQILKDLNVRRMRLLSVPRKTPSLTGYDLEVTGFVALSTEQV
jgi:3,4-dihydroxy 2-butanone 4-phosphate synthase / GTP cyclohydrolase II